MLLTIAMPTYNRAERLRMTLLEFVAQFERTALTDVEIVVSDNCSSDATPQVCADIAVAHPALRLRNFRNATNLGFDGNVNALFGHAQGRYVWTFSDDDEPSPQVLAHVLDLLRQNEIRFAYVNYQVSVDGQRLPSRFGAGIDRWLPARDLLKTIRFSNSLISACLFSRQAWLDADPGRYLGSLWIHFFMAREVLQEGESLIVGQPMFTMTENSLVESRAEKLREIAKAGNLGLRIDTPLRGALTQTVCTLQAAARLDRVNTSTVL
jgi:glycosyltransferase involved in cell wall biosynthesis